MSLQRIGLSERLKAEKALRSFSAFVRYTWPIIESGTSLIWNWHMDAICEHLQAVHNGDIKRLLINMPPRHGKSSLISVIWPVWSITLNPADRWLCASYVMDLAARDNRRSRDIINHHWYQERYGDLIKLKHDQNEKTNWETQQGGYRIAASVNGASTGKGGDKLLLDDPHRAGESDLKVERAVSWFREVWNSRLNDREKGAMIVVMQRLHKDDISGCILDSAGWEHLCLPAEFDMRRRCSTGIGWTDPRTVDGELLWPEKFTQQTLDVLKADLGPLAYEGQYNQSPVPPGGYIFKRDDERFFRIDGESYIMENAEGQKTILIEDCSHFVATDLAISSKQEADWTVYMFFAVTPERDVLLLEVRRGHWTHPTQLTQLKLLFQHYTGILEPEKVYIEVVAYQAALAQDAKAVGIPVVEFRPVKDKVSRSASAAIWYANHKVYHLKNAVWLPELQKELFFFPKARNDDQVDCISIACSVVRLSGPRAYDISRDNEPMVRNIWSEE
jgi:predicted phage terminase large subunit-like protein